MDGIGCPWGYEESEEEMLRTCVASPRAMGLGEAPTMTIDEYRELEIGSGIILPDPRDPVRAPQSMGSMNVSAGPSQAFDSSWLFYGGLALVGLLLLSKGGRR